MLSSHVSEKIWQQIKQQLNREAGKTVYNNWLESLKLVSFSDGKIEIGSHSDFHKNWIEPRYGNRIKSLWLASSDEIKSVIFVVDKNMTSSSGSKKQSKKFNNLPISSPLDPRYKFEKFVVGPSNDFVAAAAQRVAETEDVAFNPLVIYGGVGLGKTHLMHSIAWRIREINPNRQVVYLSAEKFMYQFVRALRQQETMVFKEQFRSADVLMVDDVQFIAGKDSTQEEFFHTFNALVDQNKQIVVSSDRSPADLEGIEERLRSRLGWGIVAEIHQTTYELRLGILQVKADDIKNCEIEPKVIEFLAHKITSNIRELEGALKRLVAHSQLVGRPITLENTQDVLHDLLRANDRRVTIEEIQKKVAEHFNTRLSDMSSPRRARAVARPRQVAMYLAKQLTSRSLPEIGRKFGGRDHTTVMHAVSRIESLIHSDSAIADDLELLKRMLDS
ncbi:MAG: Chromosomal replication initiator protein DnaA [Alphaproteobacteria bacterium MarineAlpha9_Bin2]|nr:MAG: Chromosomal replication initiator protein DnaA [Alphaproteobacteria bacterium MarineAlpha9_Bin2]